MLLCGILNIAHAQWQRVNNGVTPTNAFVAGNEADGSPLYIVRVNHEGGVQVGKARANTKDAFIPYGGAEVVIQNYEIYTGTGRWVQATACTWPQNAIVGGREPDGRLLYIVRATLGGGIHPGKARLNADAFIPHGGVENVVTDFEVLTRN